MKCLQVYIADTYGYALVIWNKNGLFRLEKEVFKAQKKYGEIEIAGDSFNVTDGIMGMSLSPTRRYDGNRYLFFSPYSSRSLYAASTKVLKRKNGGAGIKFSRGIDVLQSQSPVLVFSAKGVLFYALTKEIAIGCWNANKPLKSEYFVRSFAFY